MVAGSGLVLPPDEDAQQEETLLRWVGNPSVKGPRWMRYPLITAGMLGVQGVWTILMSQASPYLIELGLSKSLMSLVFVAGPLSGLIMQPLIGIIADRSKSRFGRRRPFIVGGCVLTIIATLMLSRAKNIAALFLGSDSPHPTFSIILAVTSVFLVDFSVNAIMAADRALLVDTLPPSEQEAGNAWAGRLAGFGAVAGFWVGNLDLLKVLPFLGQTQLQALAVLAGLILVITHTLTACSVEERVLISDSRPPQSFLATLRSIYTSTLTLPPAIRTLCFVQFFAWIGWFPILFFTSVWVSDIYTRAALALPDSPWKSASDVGLYEEATRAGSRALFWNAVVAFVTAVLMPLLVAKSHKQEETGEPGWLEKLGVPEAAREWVGRWEGLSLGWVWVGSHILFAILMFLTLFVSSVAGANVIIGLTGFCWAITQWAPFSILGELILADLTRPSTPHYSLHPLRSRSTLRISGSQTSVNEEAEALMLTSKSYNDQEMPRSPPRAGNERGSEDGERVRGSEDDDDEEREGRKTSGESDEQEAEEDLDLAEEEMRGGGARQKGQGTAEKAGVILGIHNVFIVIPQFLVTFLSSIIFYLLEPARDIIHVPIPPTSTIGGTNSTLSNSTLPAATTHLVASIADAVLLRERQKVESGEATGSSDAVGFIFRFGGVSACVAGVLCWRMVREKERLLAARGGG